MSRARGLVALDADGTLLDERKTVTPRARAALEALTERGHEILICTGRRYRTALPLLEQVGLPLTVAAHNGVLVRRTSDHVTIARRLMDPDAMHEVVRHLRDEGLHPVVYVDRYHEGIDFVLDGEHPDDPYWTDIHRKNRDHFLRTEDVLAWREDILVVAVWEEADRLWAADRRFAARFGGRLTHHVVTNVQYLGAVFEAYSIHGDKGAAVRGHRERLGLPRESVVAIGDDVNDLPMLREAGLGIAMGNALPAVREAADRVTATNEEDGVAKALERWVLAEG